MKLISGRVKNIGPFFGEQKINFETKPDSPLNVVVGFNGTGKSSIVRAIGWALHGNKDLSLHCEHHLINWDARSRGIQTGSVELTFQHLGRHYLLTRLVEISKKDDRRSTETSLSIFDVTDKNGTLLLPNAKDFLESILPLELAYLIFQNSQYIDGMGNITDGDLSPIGRAIKSLFIPNADLEIDVKDETEGKHSLTEDEILKIIEIAVNDQLRSLYPFNYSISFNPLGGFEVFGNGQPFLPEGVRYLISLITHCVTQKTIWELLVKNDHIQEHGTEAFPLFLDSPFQFLDSNTRLEALNFLVTLDRPIFLTLNSDFEWLVENGNSWKKIAGLHALVSHDRKLPNHYKIDFSFRGLYVLLAVEDSTFIGTEIKSIAI